METPQKTSSARWSLRGRHAPRAERDGERGTGTGRRRREGGLRRRARESRRRARHRKATPRPATERSPGTRAACRPGRSACGAGHPPRFPRRFRMPCASSCASAAVPPCRFHQGVYTRCLRKINRRFSLWSMARGARGGIMHPVAQAGACSRRGMRPRRETVEKHESTRLVQNRGHGRRGRGGRGHVGIVRAETIGRPRGDCREGRVECGSGGHRHGNDEACRHFWPSPKPLSEFAETKDYDVVVVGAGVPGMAAAVCAGSGGRQSGVRAEGKPSPRRRATWRQASIWSRRARRASRRC